MVWLALSLCGTALHAQAPAKKIAMVSTIGDEMPIVIYRSSTGTNIDPNLRRAVPIESPTFNHTALLAAADALAMLRPELPTALLQVPAGASGGNEALVLEGDGLSPQSAALAAVRSEGASHLLLVAKHRAPARLQFADGTVGSGSLRGLGFYIDPTMGTRTQDTLESAQGFIAPYAYFRAALIDLESLAVLRAKTVTASVAVSSARNKDGRDAWGAMTSEEKVSALNGLIRAGVAEAVRAVLAQP